MISWHLKYESKDEYYFKNESPKSSLFHISFLLLQKTNSQHNPMLQWNSSPQHWKLSCETRGREGWLWNTITRLLKTPASTQQQTTNAFTTPAVKCVLMRTIMISPQPLLVKIRYLTVGSCASASRSKCSFAQHSKKSFFSISYE